MATLEQMQARYGATPLEQVRAEGALEDAINLVRGETGKDWDNEAIPAPLVTVVLKVALRTYRNPEFLAAETQNAGPFSQAKTRSSDGQTGYLTEVEILLCRRYATRSIGLWSLSTTRGEEYDPEEWVMDQFGSEPFPIGEA